MLLSLDLSHGERSAGWRGYSWTPTFLWMSAVLEAQPWAMLGGQNKAGPKTWKGPCDFSEHLGVFRFGIRPRSSCGKSIIRCCKKRGLIVIGFGCGGWTWRRGQDWQTEPAPPRAQGSNPSRSSGCCCCLDYWEIKLCFWANGIMQLGQGTAHQPLSFKGLVGNGKEAQKKPLPCQVQNLPDQALLCQRDTVVHPGWQGQIWGQESGKRWEQRRASQRSWLWMVWKWWAGIKLFSTKAMGHQMKLAGARLKAIDSKVDFHRMGNWVVRHFA